MNRPNGRSSVIVLCQLLRNLLVQNLANGQSDDGLTALAEEGVDLAQGVGCVIERGEEALGAVLAALSFAARGLADRLAGFFAMCSS